MKFVLVGIFLMVSCGQDVKHTGGIPTGIEKDQNDESGTEQPSVAEDDTAMMIQDGAEIPPCDKDNKLIYVKAESTFKVCAAGVWENVDLKGAAGTNGTDNRIMKSVTCVGGLGDTVWNAQYSAVLMASGDVFVSANISDGYLSSSNTNFFSSQQVGATIGAVNIIFDGVGTANYGFWMLSLNRETMVTTVVYKDSEYAGGGALWTMTPDKCVVNDYTTP